LRQDDALLDAGHRGPCPAQSEAVDPAGDIVEKILEAAESCPVNAIFVDDAETREQLFP
jgi:ferredoxin